MGLSLEQWPLHWFQEHHRLGRNNVGNEVRQRGRTPEFSDLQLENFKGIKVYPFKIVFSKSIQSRLLSLLCAGFVCLFDWF